MTPLLAGETLARALASRGALPGPAEAWAVLRPVAEALARRRTRAGRAPRREAVERVPRARRARRARC
ncbi:MAG: hypothetical protein U0325_35655 [Polyangiales bacterium]